MQEKIDRLIRAVYRNWKADNLKAEPHPDEETFVCFLENRLSRQEAEAIKEHLMNCDSCAEIIAVQMKLKDTGEAKELPLDLLERLKCLGQQQDKVSSLDIFLKLKEKALEILSTTGDVLVGQELVPAPVLRTRKIKDFKDEVTILKDFKDIRVEAKIENKNGGAFSLTVVVKEKTTQKVMKDLRVTLIKDDIELESYLSDSGRVHFEHVLLGKYTVEISAINNKLASILLDIKA